MLGLPIAVTNRTPQFQSVSYFALAGWRWLVKGVCWPDKPGRNEWHG